MGMTSIQSFWRDHIEREQLPCGNFPEMPWGDDPPQPLDKASIFSLYVEDELKHRRKPIHNTMFWYETKRMFKLPKNDFQPRATGQKRCILLPGLSSARRMFEQGRNPMGRG